jgi:hypothetical protein
MIRDTNPPEADQSESGVSEPKTTLFGEAIFQKIRGCFNQVFSEHDTVMARWVCAIRGGKQSPDEDDALRAWAG